MIHRTNGYSNVLAHPRGWGTYLSGPSGHFPILCLNGFNFPVQWVVVKVAAQIPDRLVASTVPVTAPDDLIARLPNPTALAWVRDGDGLVGWGEAARVVVPAGEDRFARAPRWLRDLVDAATLQ